MASRKKTPLIVLSGWTELPIQAVKADSWDAVLGRLQHELTFETADSREYSGAVADTRVTLQEYSVVGSGDSRVLRIPRYYLPTLEPFLLPEYTQPDVPEHVHPDVMFDDRRASGREHGFRDWSFTGRLIEEPRRNQHEAVSVLSSTYGGILVAAPGKGKTVMALAAAAKVHCRTLIIVPTTILLDQWLKRIFEYTDLTESEVGIVQGSRCDWRSPLIVGTVHSLAQKDYPPEFYDNVGLVITDEVHRIGAPTWLKVLPRFSGKYRWGLSATPTRPDQMHKAFMAHIGPVLFEMTELEVRPKVYRILTGVQIPARSYSNWRGQPNFARMYNALSEHGPRNTRIVDDVVKAWRAGRKILVLSNRVKHLAHLHHRCLQAGVPAEQLGVLVGNVKPRDRDIILKERKVIFAIAQIAGLGLDQPDLDTLVWAMPSQSVEQNMGRIERICANKKPPLALDYVDNFGMLVAMARKRKRVFLQRGYEVVDVRAALA